MDFKCLSALSFVLFLKASNAHSLVTQGPWILNSTNRQRIHLKCANWYGAHQELYVVGGLELLSVSRLVKFFQESGSNCARIPYSIEMVKNNPTVNQSAVAGILPSDQCRSTLRALDVMDCVVSHLQQHGILIIFNCHNSHGTWVGAGAVKNDQGLWNLPEYSSEDWIQSMEIIARRYKGIAGMDFRNEIHDQDGVKITWGETDNINTDWLAASTAAYDRLYNVDPEILAIVGALCWNTDLRAMVKKVGPLKALTNHKLVYTVHIYTFSFWWDGQTIISNEMTIISLGGFILCLVIAFIFIWIEKKRSNVYNTPVQQPDKIIICRLWSDEMLVFISTSTILHIGWLILAIVYNTIAINAGCSMYANDSNIFIIFTSILSLIAICCGIDFVYNSNRVPWVLTAASVFFWLSILFLSIFVAGSYLASDAAYSDSLKSWSLDNRSVPVWVGEFGTGTPDERKFKMIWDFINSKYKLDFAYWAFNGRKWWEGKWESEGFGLMNDQYTAWRHPNFTHALFTSNS